MNNFYQDKHIWITGASSGIGAALAKKLREQGAHVAISGRNISALKQLADELKGEKTIILPFDVMDELAHQKAVDQLMASWGKIDIAILNAGVSQSVDLMDYAPTAEMIIKTNLLGVVYGLDPLLKAMMPVNRGQIAVISSLAGFRAFPGSEAYCASKAGVRLLLQGLSMQLMKTKLKVTCVCPGFIKTPLTEKNDFPMPFLMSTEKAADILLKRLPSAKFEICFPWRMSFLVKLMSCLPLSWYMKLVGRRAQGK